MQKTTKPNRLLVYFFRVLLLVVFLALWEANGYLKWVNPLFVSKPSDILLRTLSWAKDGKILIDIGVTLTETVLAFVLGSLLGFLLAIWLYTSVWAEQILLPYTKILNAMPRIIFAPIFTLWFGLGITSKVVLGTTIVIFIVFFAAYTGLKEVNEDLISKVYVLGGNQHDVLMHVLIPSAMSWLFSSLTTAVGFAIVGAVVGEYMGAARGLGFRIAFSEGMFDTAGVFAGLLILSFVIIFVNIGLERLQKKLMPWESNS
jgi:NitT/TauT family transport system permease protein